MRYSNRGYSSNRSTPPEIEKGGDEVRAADREQINKLFSELEIDATAEEVLEGAEAADVSLQVQLDQGYAKDYWKATMHNDDVLAKNLTIEIDVEGGKNQRYEAKDVWKPAYDVFNLSSYMDAEGFADSEEVADLSSANVNDPATTD
ncbi:MAG: hypothetical protein ABEK00_00725 [Candidatus Nanohaloarchaea archaeon]